MITSTNIHSTTQESLLKLYEHPNWRGEESKVELTPGTFAIVREPNSSNFYILWSSKKGERTSVPFFVTDASIPQWSFQNGHMNIFDKLDKLILAILKHLQECE